MNVETGQLYRTEAEAAAAVARGEPIVRVSDQVARLIGAGRRAQDRARAKRKRKAAKTSRRKNRR